MFGWDCPKCGTQNEEPVNNNFYGSPIKHCIKCGYEHLERRWSEIAIDGPRKQANSISVNLLLLAFFAGIAWIGFWFREESNQTRLIQKTDILIFTGIVACIAIVYQIFRILTGYEDKVTKKYTEESEMRMRDLEYVKKLIRYGYAVPQKYRDGIDEVDVEISDNCDSEHYVQEHDDYERVKFPDRLDYHPPRDFGDLRSLKKYRREGILGMIFPAVWFVMYICVMVYLILHPEEGATAGIFIGLSVFTFTIVAVFGFYFFLGTFGNPIVANTIVVSKWSISKLHRVILAQENSKKICYNVEIVAGDYEKVKEGDKVDVVTVGQFYKAFKRE